MEYRTTLMTLRRRGTGNRLGEAWTLLSFGTQGHDEAIDHYRLWSRR